MKENNKLIAEFMGIHSEKGFWGWHLISSSGKTLTHLSTWKESQSWDTLFNNETMYHNSWDWLMPVVHCIANDREYQKYLSDMDLGYLRDSFTGGGGGLGSSFTKHYDIDVVYAAVVTTIKISNANKNK